MLLLAAVIASQHSLGESNVPRHWAPKGTGNVVPGIEQQQERKDFRLTGLSKLYNSGATPVSQRRVTVDTIVQ
jgi:hypothetical protein